MLVKTESILSTPREFTLVVSQTNAYGKIKHVTESSELENTTPEQQVTAICQRGCWQAAWADGWAYYGLHKESLFLIILGY